MVHAQVGGIREKYTEEKRYLYATGGNLGGMEILESSVGSLVNITVNNLPVLRTKKSELFLTLGERCN